MVSFIIYNFKKLECYHYDIKNEECRWYVVHTYSGYENKVKSTLDNIIETRNIRELISFGKIEKANELLGHPYTISGKVTEGNKIGQKIESNIELSQKII